jgi:ABC-2 type transport system ATP-binding protein
MIKIENLSKKYKKVQALDNISLNVEKGELFGLIGPDGAGKTTLMRILTTLLEYDSGNVEVCGLNPIKDYKKLRSKLGYMPGRFSLYQDLTVEENLKFFASIFNSTIEENYDLIKDIYQQIEPFKKRRAGQLSGGMKQKLALSCALIHKPEVLILDEPTTGVDAVSRSEFWGMLKNLKKLGIAIFVSTPYMDEASLCDRIALIQDGKILDIDKPDNIIKKYDYKIYNIGVEDKYHTLEFLKNLDNTLSVYPFGEFIHYIDKRSSFNTNDLKKEIDSNLNTNCNIELSEKTIEDVFIHLMKKNN